MDYTKSTVNQVRAETHYDEGLRSYMLSVFNYMASGLAITGVVALMIFMIPGFLDAVFNTPLKWVVMFAPLVMVFFVMPRIFSFTLAGAQMAFWVFAGLMGASLSWIFVAYTGESIVRVFFITAATFGSMSLYGYTTKRDLTSMGSFMIMGLIGVIIASIVNIFLHSSALQFALSILTVFIFLGLTAYDTQRIKSIYYQFAGTGEMVSKFAIYGALSLYMDFINLFITLLQFFGDRR